MIKKMILGAGMAYMARKFMGGRSNSMATNGSRGGRGGLGGLFGGGGNRFGRRSSGW